MQDKHREVLIMIIAGGTIIFILIGIVVFVLVFYQKKRFLQQQRLAEIENGYEKQLLATRLEMQEQTLQLFGQELHDNIGQLLSTTKMFMSLAMQSRYEVPQPLNTAHETLSKAIKELRALSKSLNREWLNQFDLRDNLKLEADRLTSSGTIAVILNCTNETIPLKSEAQIMVFRVVQEAIQNSIKHAQASKIVLDLDVLENAIGITIADNGIGFIDTSVQLSGVGIINMRYRTELLGGTITWTSEVGKGTIIKIFVPGS